MTGWVALLRAVNVGGTGKIAMSDLKVLCEALGLDSVRTYIASGNVVFTSDLGEGELRTLLEDAIAARYGSRIVVLVRSAADLAGVLARNPWPDSPGNRVLVLFTDATPTLEGVRHQAGELLALGLREVFIEYTNGVGTSKLVIPAATSGTARNMNTVARLAQMAAEATSPRA